MSDVEREKVPCPDCGELYTVTAAGTIRKHKCSGAIDIDNPGGGASSSPAVPKIVLKARRPAPKNVRAFGVAGVATGVEKLSARVVKSATGLDTIPDEVVEIPDAEGMIGPFLDILWPQLPKGTQKFISFIADQSDVIAATLAWIDYAGTLKSFVADNAKPADTAAANEGTPSGTLAFLPASQQSAGTAAGNGYEPFQPVPTQAEAYGGN